MTHLLPYHSLHSAEIGDFLPKATSVVGNQVEASRQFWTGIDGNVSSGIWECTPGRFNAYRETTETCYILSGQVTLHSENGQQHFFGPGDMFTLPVGWRGSWEVHETVRKVYFISAGNVRSE